MYANSEENPENDRVLRQLKDMFTSIPNWRLREVCKSNNWKLNSCIDQLMSIMVNNAPDNIKESQQPNNRQRTNECRKDIEKLNFTKDEERVGSLIKKGYRVMILMRGPPGVGKSYLARSLVTCFADLESNGFNIHDFICSTDDYFYNAKGVYKYNPASLPDAHEFNHQRVANKAKSGLSPIVVDNTNMQIWEMLPYVKQAVLNDYLIEIIEPKTTWRNSSRTLAQKNKHGVPPNRIQRIMDKYEKCSVDTLTRMLKNTKYMNPLPQMRLLPPLKSCNSESIRQQQNDKLEQDIAQEDNSLTKEDFHAFYSFSPNEPKEQRGKFKSRSPSKSIEFNQTLENSTRDVYSLLEQKTSNIWKPFETESADFWGIQQPPPQLDIQSSNATNEVSGAEKSLLDLLKENSDDATKDNDYHQTKNSLNYSSFERHSINCPNENETFVSLRQIYPNKRVSGLWDLFVKCNGDVDWAVDILLKEDELERIRGDGDYSNYQIEDDEVYECSCNNSKEKVLKECYESNSGGNVEQNNFENLLSILDTGHAKPQRQKSRNARTNQTVNPALLEVKESIENCFILGDDHYSDHLLKIRNLRSGLNSDVVAPLNATTKSYETLGNEAVDIVNREDCGTDYIGMEDDNDDDDEDNAMNDLGDDMVEMPLGEQLIQQLVDTFRNESCLEEHISSQIPLNLKVVMPRSLAKQLYMLWVESAYNYMEEERQKLVQEDQDFARLLKNPKYAEYKQSPSNLREILDMEYAWKIYNQNKQEKQQQLSNDEKKEIPKDLASHLTHMKLCEAFPEIPRETLIDILDSNGNDYNATVSVLRSTMQNDNENKLEPTTQEQLIECALQEQNLINLQVQKQLDARQERESLNWNDEDVKSALSPEETKRLALREFEESRNLAAHHCQLKAECYQKAKEAIQSGNGGVANYYSQIANLHKKKIDMYNHRAANCIMDVHKYTQNNPDLLDLHYLHLVEALGCLDLFLDRHITDLRVASGNYKHVFIITGRGKHSAGGVSTIKNKVKARLKERFLRWSEVNPGLLKVKIFSGSRHSKNI